MHVPFWKNASIKKLKSSNVATLGVAGPKKNKAKYKNRNYKPPASVEFAVPSL